MMYIFIYKSTYSHIYLHTYTHMCICSCLYINLYIQMYIYTNTRLRIYVKRMCDTSCIHEYIQDTCIYTNIVHMYAYSLRRPQIESKGAASHTATHPAIKTESNQKFQTAMAEGNTCICVYACTHTTDRVCVYIYIYIYTYVNIPHIESIQDSATLWGCNTLQRIPQHILQRMLHYRSKVIKSWRRNRQKRIHRAAAMHCDSHCNTCCNTDRKQSSVPDGTGKRGCVLLLQHSALQQTATHPATHTATRTATQIESNEEFQKELAKGDTSLDSASADQLRDQVFDCICLYKYICTCVQIYK